MSSNQTGRIILTRYGIFNTIMSLRLSVFVSACGYRGVRHDPSTHGWITLTVGEWVEPEGPGVAWFCPESKEASCSGDN